MPTMLEFGGPLYDGNGLYHRVPRKDRNGIPLENFTVILSSSSAYRTQGLTGAVQRLGLPNHIKKIDGPPQEEGATPLERATHKNLVVAQKLLATDYFDRHPWQTVLLVAADSRNKYQGAYRDKPTNPDEFTQFGEEWERVALGEERVVDETGYSLVAIHRSKISLTGIVDRVSEVPYSRRTIQEYFHTDMWPRGSRSSHGFFSEGAIKAGLLQVSRGTQVLHGRHAVDAIYGSESRHFQALLTMGINHFAQCRPM